MTAANRRARRRGRPITNEQMASGNVPYRTCIACGARKDKRSLIRVVRTPESGIIVGATGRQSGRGAYLCPAAECWERGLKGGRIERALRTRLTDDERQSLLEYTYRPKESQQV
ncbi:MAG: RNase P modulator RnpM [Chloroflexota bacterium]